MWRLWYHGNGYQRISIYYCLPEKARYDYLLNLPDDADCGKAVNEAMELIEAESTQLKGILPKTYTSFRNDLLKELLRIFNNSALNEINDDILGRIYEYFLNKLLQLSHRMMEFSLHLNL